MTLDLPDDSDLIVAVDTECSGLHPDDGARVSIVSVAWSNGSRVFPFDQGPYTWLGPKLLPRKYPGPSLFDKDENLGIDEWWGLCRWLSRQQLVFHNATYDLTMIAAGLRGMRGSGYDLSSSYVWDTMVVAPLLWPNERVSLDHLGNLVLGRSKDHANALNSWRKRYLDADSMGRYDLVPNDLVLPYAQQDPELTLALYQVETEMVDEGAASWEAVDREIDLALVLYRMQQAGIGFDVDECRHQDSLLAKMEDLYSIKVAEIIGKSAATEDTMRRYWFDELSVDPVKLTPDEKPAVSADVVRALVTANVPAAAEWQSLVKVRTARKMWYGPWPKLAGEDGRLRTVYRQTKSASNIDDDSGPERGARSARLAVERVQMQAIPHDYQIPEGIVPIRKLFRARPGHRLVEIDISQAEMRAVAGLSRCKSLLDRFAAGEDAHTATCRLVFRIDQDEPRWDFYRGVAKRLNFGIVYGAGIPTLAAQIEQWTGHTTEAEVGEWWADAKRSMPEIFAMSRALRRHAEDTRQVPLVGGRVRFFAPFEFVHKAMNAQIQGSVAVAMADAMIEISRLHEPDLLLLQIHDSIVIEPPQEQADQITVECQQIICDVFEHHFHAPFVSDSKVWA